MPFEFQTGSLGGVLLGRRIHILQKTCRSMVDYQRIMSIDIYLPFGSPSDLHFRGRSPYRSECFLTTILFWLQPDCDIRLSGHVSWVGKSSLEVTVWLEQEQNNKWINITRSIFLLAARNSTNTGPAIVNKLVATTPEEEDILKGGLGRPISRWKSQ